MIRELTSATLILVIWLDSNESLAQELGRPDGAIQINATQVQYGLNPKLDLMERVGETPENVLTIFREAGMSPKPYSLSEHDRQQLIAAIAILPPLHQSVLKQRLRSISLLNDMPNTALTSTVNPKEPFRLFDITIRAAILKQSAAEWVAEKEGSCFDKKESSFSLRVDVGNITAIQYVLLHEATHVVDAARDITPSLRPTPESVPRVPATPFTKDVWEDARTPSIRYQDRDLMSIRFRQGGKVMDASNMKVVYEALGRTPFVSLYGSSARTEDLAEYLTVFHLTQKLHQPFRVSICEGDREVLCHDPMTSEITRNRFDLMRQFYESTEGQPFQGK